MKKITEAKLNESLGQKLGDLFHLVNTMHLLMDKGYLETDEDTCVFADDVEPQDVIDFLKDEGMGEYTSEDLDAMCMKLENILKG